MSDAKRRTDALAAGLAARILSGTGPEGTKLPVDNEIGREFGVSRTVIREAYRILSGKGLLVSASAPWHACRTAQRLVLY